MRFLCFQISAGAVVVGFAQIAPVVQQTPKTSQVVAVAPLSLPKSPAEDIRQLLRMNETERQRFLAAKTPEYRQSVEPKLVEFQLLPPPERELRLTLIGLRWHLPDLMRLAPADRTARLALLPKADRSLIEDRLKQWDKLPLVEQEELLTNQMTISYFLRLTTSTPAQRTALLQNFTEAQKSQIETNLSQLDALPEDTRQKMLSRFQSFFELNEKEKAKVLAVLPDTQRQQTEKTLERFRTLSRGEREASLVGFRKFMRLSPNEQGRFLQTAARWQAMPPSDRQAWREVVNKMPDMPPLPPGLLPPLPPGLKATLVPAATNGVSTTNK
jgi:uncharacterized protein DUF3106